MARDEVSVAAEERCIVCGHCVAVCPTQAISHGGLSGPCDMLDEGLTVDPRCLMQLIRSRRSVRAYRDEPVSDADLAALIEAARYAPTAHNAQPWQFIVIRDRGKLARIAESVVCYMESRLHDLAGRGRREALAAALSPEAVERLRDMAPTFRAVVSAQRAGRDIIFRGAPALIVIHTPRSAGFGAEDAHYAAANIMLMAHGIGLGTCLVGFLVATARSSREVAAEVGLPAEHDMGAALVVGHPEHRYHRIVPRRQPPVAWL
jgi:nitroreductase